MRPCEPVELHIEEGGTGTPIIFCHGFGGSARNFRAQMRALAPNHHTIAFDARGHGRSGAPKDAAAYDPRCFTEDLHRVVLQKNRDEKALDGQAADGQDVQSASRAPVAICGLSMGAGIALRYAIGHSEVYALVLASFPRTSDDSANREWAMGFADAIEQSGLDVAGERYVWGARGRFDPAGAALIRQGFLEHAPHALAHTLRQVLAVQPGPNSLKRELRHLQIPTLVVAGARDEHALTASRELVASLPNAELEVIPDAGHVVNLEARDRFNHVLTRFLDAHAPVVGVQSAHETGRE